MIQIWLVELLKGTGRLFLHPVLYYLMFIAAVLGVRRVKRERKNFHIRAFDAYFELRQLFPLGLLLGLILSILTIAAGISVPLASVLLVAAFTLLLSLTTNVRLLSPAYTVGAAFFAVIILGGIHFTLPIFNQAFLEIKDKVYPSIVVVLGLLTIAEGILIYKNGRFGTSPKLVKSKRGQNVGLHEVRRVWILPLFLLIPGSVLELPFDWWPVFHLGAEKFSLILVPFAGGFQQKIQGMLPKESVEKVGRQVISLGVLVTLLSAAGFWYPLASIIVAAIAIVGRELISLLQRLHDDSRPAYFSRKNNGLMIIGIIPNSPASKMDLKVGELISKANGLIVRDESSFYEALQRNRAHCKLEVIDTNGEIRFVQRALYEGDHHELGALFVQDTKGFDEKIG